MKCTLSEPKDCLIHRTSVFFCLSSHTINKIDPLLCPICSSFFTYACYGASTVARKHSNSSRGSSSKAPSSFFTTSGSQVSLLPQPHDTGMLEVLQELPPSYEPHLPLYPPFFLLTCSRPPDSAHAPARTCATT